MFVYPWLDSLAQCGTVSGKNWQVQLRLHWNSEVPFRHDLPPPNHLGRPPPLRGSHPAPMCDILPPPSSTVWTCLDQVYGRGRGHGLGQVAAFKVMLDSA